jgi:DNA-binding LacI/PurR family transcriptional regulator
MPKKVLESLIRRIADDIGRHYGAGERYRTIAESTRLFGASTQTVQRAIAALRAEGVVTVKPKEGIRVVRSPGGAGESAKDILVITPGRDPQYMAPFTKGILTAVGKAGYGAVPVREELPRLEYLEFGLYLERLYRRGQCAGAVLLYMPHCEVALYHCVERGVPVLTNIACPAVPGAPSLLPDERAAIARAMEVARSWRKHQVLIVGRWEAAPRRYELFRSAFRAEELEARVSFVDPTQPEADSILLGFIASRGPGNCVFSVDTWSNCHVASIFHRLGIPFENNLMIYDSEEPEFAYPGQPLLKPISLDFTTFGQRLGEKMLYRLQNGKWKDPVQELI